MFLIKGQIIASVRNGLLISAKIDLTGNGASLDTKRSKWIISSKAKKLGAGAYENDEKITSLDMTTGEVICKAGRYCVRYIIFDTTGKCREIVSKEVVTVGESISFEYEGKSRSVSLSEGRYKLEVWGAQGGDSSGEHCNAASPIQGGLGGYSVGHLELLVINFYIQN